MEHSSISCAVALSDLLTDDGKLAEQQLAAAPFFYQHTNSTKSGREGHDRHFVLMINASRFLFIEDKKKGYNDKEDGLSTT